MKKLMSALTKTGTRTFWGTFILVALTLLPFAAEHKDPSVKPLAASEAVDPSIFCWEDVRDFLTMEQGTKEGEFRTSYTGLTFVPLPAPVRLHRVPVLPEDRGGGATTDPRARRLTRRARAGGSIHTRGEER